MNKERGTVKYYNDEKGYGFIARDNGSDAFFHISKVLTAIDMRKGVNVAFTVEKNEKGYVATDVEIVN